MPVCAGTSLKASRATELRRDSNSFSVTRPAAANFDFSSAAAPLTSNSPVI